MSSVPQEHPERPRELLAPWAQSVGAPRTRTNSPRRRSNALLPHAKFSCHAGGYIYNAVARPSLPRLDRTNSPEARVTLHPGAGPGVVGNRLSLVSRTSATVASPATPQPCRRAAAPPAPPSIRGNPPRCPRAPAKHIGGRSHATTGLCTGLWRVAMARSGMHVAPARCHLAHSKESKPWY